MGACSPSLWGRMRRGTAAGGGSCGTAGRSFPVVRKRGGIPFPLGANAERDGGGRRKLRHGWPVLSRGTKERGIPFPLGAARRGTAAGGGSCGAAGRSFPVARKRGVSPPLWERMRRGTAAGGGSCGAAGWFFSVTRKRGRVPLPFGGGAERDGGGRSKSATLYH